MLALQKFYDTTITAELGEHSGFFRKLGILRTIFIYSSQYLTSSPIVSNKLSIFAWVNLRGCGDAMMGRNLNIEGRSVCPIVLL